MEQERVSLATLKNGGAVEMFDAELAKVVENILDINTDPKATREVTLKVKIKPTDDREMGVVEIAAGSKMAPVKPAQTKIYMGMDGNKATAVEQNPRQPSMFAPSSDSAN